MPSNLTPRGSAAVKGILNLWPDSPRASSSPRAVALKKNRRKPRKKSKCRHDIVLQYCGICKTNGIPYAGSSLCIHGRRKTRCRVCFPQSASEICPLCEKRKTPEHVCKCPKCSNPKTPDHVCKWNVL